MKKEPYMPIDPSEVVPWDISYTNRWPPKDLAVLRDTPVGELARTLRDRWTLPDIDSVILEFIGHGEFKRAVQFVRFVSKGHPDIREALKKGLSPSERRVLFTLPLEEIPNTFTMDSDSTPTQV